MGLSVSTPSHAPSTVDVYCAALVHLENDIDGLELEISITAADLATTNQLLLDYAAALTANPGQEAYWNAMIANGNAAKAEGEIHLAETIEALNLKKL